jgi:hypothetical protein
MKNKFLLENNEKNIYEVNKLTAQNEFLKNYYFQNENKIKNEAENEENKLKENNIGKNEKKYMLLKENKYITELEEMRKGKIELEKELNEYKMIINGLKKEKMILENKLLNKNTYENELKLTIKEMQNEDINNKKELIKKSIEYTDLEEKNIQNAALNDKLSKEIEKKNKINKSSIYANNSLKKINDDFQREILNLSSENYVLEKRDKEKEEYIKELQNENNLMKNEILKLKKDNDTLYKVLHKNKLIF